MIMDLSNNVKATLLMTAPLIAGANNPSAEILTPSEYRRVAKLLYENGKVPSDLLGPDANSLIVLARVAVDEDRIRRLLARGFLLAQAVDRWTSRGIWVIGRTDPGYPRRFNERLKSNAPAVLYGCGDPSILETGGLAIVGSRQPLESVLESTRAIGRMAAESGVTVVSGGARGIDDAAKVGALEACGRVACVLSDSLERRALSRVNRDHLQDGRLVLISPYDPMAGFNVGHAMQRNKLIYALADASLVMNAEYNKGGTWEGAVEQLENLHYVPVYVRADGSASGPGLEELRKRGAVSWPNPMDSKGLVEVVSGTSKSHVPAQTQLGLQLTGIEETSPSYQSEPGDSSKRTDHQFE